MHIKVFLVNRFIGVQCDANSTSNDIIEYILQRNLVPIAYKQVCALIYCGPKGYAIPMQSTQKLSDAKNKEVHFCVLVLPLREQVQDLDINFLFLIQAQMHKLIINRQWLVNQNASMLLAAYQCSIEFGEFVQERHNVGFLSNSMQNFLPKYMVKNKAFEDGVLCQWQALSMNGLIPQKEPFKEQSVRNYVEYAAREIPQFGSASTEVNLIKIGNEKQKHKEEILLSISQKSVMLLQKDSKILFNATWSSVQLNIDETTLFTVVVEDKSYTLECIGIQAFQQVVNFIKASSYPTKEEVMQSKTEDNANNVYETK